ncbi:hypothetical protein [Chishuiella changwenlii]|uniref:hypothetical protein n=1 Tax=Chishuiella changwenlii TaxID=1434701 RepID=UPI002FD98D3F
MKTRIILLITLFFSQLCYCQGLINIPIENNPVRNIVTPEVNNLLRYHDFPDVGFIGGTDITIPIYEIKYDGLSIPISLSYNTKGAKVADIASNVGLGWTLNAGGSVTIDINERYDFSANFSKEINGRGGHIPQPITLVDGSGIYGREYKPNNIKPVGAINFSMDAAPDYYYVSAPGLNDKFYFSKSFNSYTIKSLQNFKTTLAKRVDEATDFDKNNEEFDYNAEVNYIPKKFDLRNESGFLYSFQNRILTTGYSTPRSAMRPLDNPSSWLLSSIQSPTNKTNKINFIYENFENRYNHQTYNFYHRINTGSIDISTNININRPPNNGNLILVPEKGDQLPRIKDNTTFFRNSQRIKSIVFPEGSVNFIYGNSRLDYDGEVLSRIIINDISGKEIKHFDFHYSYFQSLDNNCSGVYNCLRLKLDKIHDSSLKSNYELTYGGMRSNDNLFPSRGSGKVDFLGYYNNNSSTSDLGCKTNCFGIAYPGRGINVNKESGSSKIYFYPNLSRDHFIPFKLSNYTEESVTGIYDASSSTQSLLGLLTSIRYPTKGGLKIEYENDDFEYLGANYILGSARIKSMEYFDSKNELLRKINYSYKKSDQSSSGEINFLIPPTDIIRGEINMGYKNSAIVGYSKITQEEIGNGKIEKYYSNFSSHPDVYETINPIPTTVAQKNFFKFFKYPSTFIQNMDLRRGQLIKEIVYDKNSKIKENSLEYLYYEKENFETSKIVYEHLRRGPSRVNIYEAKNKFINYQSYLSKQTTKEFKNGNVIKTEQSFNYNKKDNLLIDESIINSKNEVLTTEYTYPTDLWSDYAGDRVIYSDMESKNMLSTPIFIRKKINNTYTDEVFNFYGKDNGNIVLKEVYQKKGKDIKLHDFYKDLDYNIKNRKIVYNSYDNLGNITQYTPENGLPVAIIWGFNGQHPVAKLEGITHDIAVSKLKDYLSKLQNGTLTKDEQKALRLLIPEAIITTYVYKPLVGVTEITGPNGISEYYKYDETNRLEEIKNDKGEVLKTFEYNYKN